MKIKKIRRIEDLIETVDEIGFLPFFCSRIYGFSLEDHVADSAWYRGRWHGKRRRSVLHAGG